MLSVLACGEKKETYDTADSTAAYTDSAASIQLPKNTHIRTANLKFRVKDVVKSSDSIEDIVAKYNGYISSSNLTSEVMYKNTTQISADSSLESTHYHRNNQLSIKIPTEQLDKVLRKITQNAVFIDHKTIKSEDVYLQILSNKLQVRRNEVFQNRVANKAANIYKNITKETATEQNILDKQASSDEAIIANLNLTKQITYSTVDIDMYQHESNSNAFIACDKTIEPYEPPFYVKLWGSITTGLRMIESIILTVFQLWGIICIALIGWLLYKRYRKMKLVASAGI